MDMAGAIQTPEKQPLGACAYVLLLSHFTRGMETQKNEARRIVCQLELQFLLLERKVASLIPEKIINLSRLQAHGNDCTMQCAYACCVQIVKDVADLE